VFLLIVVHKTFQPMPSEQRADVVNVIRLHAKRSFYVGFCFLVTDVGKALAGWLTD
jgi:hypothetical protein